MHLSKELPSSLPQLPDGDHHPSACRVPTHPFFKYSTHYPPLKIIKAAIMTDTLLRFSSGELRELARDISCASPESASDDSEVSASPPSEDQVDGASHDNPGEEQEGGEDDETVA